MLRMRELFISDATDVYPVSVLRGKCIVRHCQVGSYFIFNKVKPKPGLFVPNNVKKYFFISGH